MIPLDLFRRYPKLWTLLSERNILKLYKTGKNSESAGYVSEYYLVSPEDTLLARVGMRTKCAFLPVWLYRLIEYLRPEETVDQAIKRVGIEQIAYVVRFRHHPFDTEAACTLSVSKPALVLNQPEVKRGVDMALYT